MCGDMVARRAMHGHKEKHRVEAFNCDCGIHFKTKGAKLQHMKVRHRQGPNGAQYVK
jgi:hypothetical protein